MRLFLIKQDILMGQISLIFLKDLKIGILGI